jgi:hypothetical protein
VFSAVTTFSACLRPLFSMWLSCCLCVCAQTSREVSNSTKHERRPPEDGQTIVTEICRVLIDGFYKHF